MARSAPNGSSACARNDSTVSAPLPFASRQSARIVFGAPTGQLWPSSWVMPRSITWSRQNSSRNGASAAMDGTIGCTSQSMARITSGILASRSRRSWRGAAGFEPQGGASRAGANRLDDGAGIS